MTARGDHGDRTCYIPKDRLLNSIVWKCPEEALEKRIKLFLKQRR